jgi:hypothetical protein
LKQETISERYRRLASECRVTLSYSGAGYSSGALFLSFVLLTLLLQDMEILPSCYENIVTLTEIVVYKMGCGKC